MQEVKQSILKGIIDVKIKQSEMRQASDIQSLIDIEMRRREELLRDVK